MTPKDYSAMRRGRARQARTRQKYGAKKVVVGGLTFDSKAEAARWQELRLLERAGEISDLERQVRIDLEGRDGPLKSPKGRQLYYLADFRYRDADGRIVVEDAKGYPTPEYKLKRAVLSAQGVDVIEIKRRG